jgi:molybdopterin-binding protein
MQLSARDQLPGHVVAVVKASDVMIGVAGD